MKQTTSMIYGTHGCGGNIIDAEPGYAPIGADRINPNYSFESTGTQVQYCDEADIKEIINEIIYCDEEHIER